MTTGLLTTEAFRSISRRNSSFRKPPGIRTPAVFLLPGGTAQMAKRGRPAKAGKRYANGHLKPEDQIPEGIAMRRRATLELAGAERDMRAEYPLGVCRARVLILELE